jgi:excisionase family DNA binding protein
MEVKIEIPEERIEQIAERAARKLLDELAARSGGAREVEGLVSAREAATHVGVTERQLRQLASEGLIPCYRFGSSLRFKISELESHGRVAERRAKIKAVNQ